MVGKANEVADEAVYTKGAAKYSATMASNVDKMANQENKVTVNASNVVINANIQFDVLADSISDNAKACEAIINATVMMNHAVTCLEDTVEVVKQIATERDTILAVKDGITANKDKIVANVETIAVHSELFATIEKIS